MTVFRQNNANDVTMTSLLAKTTNIEIFEPKSEHSQFVKDHFAKKKRFSKAQSVQKKKERVLENRREILIRIYAKNEKKHPC